MFYMFLIFIAMLLYFVNRFKFSTVSFFVWIYLITFHIGIVFFDLEEYQEAKTNEFILLSSLFIIFVLLGALFTKKINNLNFISLSIYKNFIEMPDKLNRLQYFNLWIVIIATFVLGFYYFRFGIPIFSDNPNMARFYAVSGATPFLFLLSYLAPMYLIVALLNRSFYLKITGVIFSVLIGFLTGFRTAPAKLLLAIFYSNFSNTKPKIVKTSIVLFIIAFVIFAVSAIKFPWLSTEEVMHKVVERVFLINIDNSLYVLDLFSEIDHFYGYALWMDLSNYVSNGLDTFGVWINMQFRGYDAGVSINPSFTIIWADFGWFYLIISFVLGAGLQLVDKLHYLTTLNRNEVVLWSFFSLTLAFACTNPYAKNLYYVLPMMLYLFVTRKFIAINWINLSKVLR